VISTGAKTAVVTGGSSGIGLGLVKAILDRDYRVVVNARNLDPARLADRGLEVSDRLALVPGDIGDAATAQEIIETANTRFGSLDVLVNNAGIFLAKPFPDYTVEEWESLLSTNVRGFIHLTQRALSAMLARGAGGSIINITASIAEQPLSAVPAVVPILTKGGLNAATRALALEYATAGIRVNAVSPGIIKTPLFGPESYDFLNGLQPVGKMGTVQDIVDAVLYLIEAPFVTGEVLHVDGGMTAGKW
jgi:NAD(P)-dependent dehydrogenase (short-subunit alcohol dehydrogenase family)